MKNSHFCLALDQLLAGICNVNGEFLSTESLPSEDSTFEELLAELSRIQE